MKISAASSFAVRLTKRAEVVIITSLLTLGFVVVQLAPPDLIASGYHIWGLAALTIISIVLSMIGLRENMRGVRWGMLVLLPAFFTAGIGLFYFLLPVRWITRIPMAIVYGVGMYAILLVANIYGVAASRSIQLLRVAHAVGFIATLTTIFFFLNTIYSFRMPAYANGLSVGILFIPILMQSFWSITLEDKISKTIWLYSLVLSVLFAQVAIVLSFWPLKPIMASLCITTLAYTIVGVVHHYLAKRLFHKNIIEYIRVFVIVFILILFTTSYRG